MEELSFGEQVKIILSRKNMTIKELAEKIQECTGKAMSRQNLTQRLGRDNFQEQDMRMIAAILGCPFRLSIFSTDPQEDEKMMEYANVDMYKKRRSRKREEEEDMYQQTLVFDEEPVENESKEIETEAAAAVPTEEKMSEDERDMTIGELYEIHEELAELEKPVIQNMERGPERIEAEESQESFEDEKKEKLHTGGIFLRRVKRDEEIQKASVQRAEEKKASKEREVITPDSEEFEPVIKHNDLEEDLTVGEMNPYTGREYQSNSVRMHPSRIGYVQVYDRKQHQWTDMTEWAFLGYQERKKALLGKDYEPPIYLD